MGHLLGGPGHPSRSTLQDTSAWHRQQPSSPTGPHQTPSTYTTNNCYLSRLPCIEERRCQRTARMGGPQPQRQQVHELSPHRCRHQELRHARSRIIHICNIFKPRPAILTKWPCQQATFAWTSKATSPTTSPGLRETRMFRYAIANDRPANGDARSPFRFEQPSQVESRSSRTLHDAYHSKNKNRQQLSPVHHIHQYAICLQCTTHHPPLPVRSIPTPRRSLTQKASTASTSHSSTAPLLPTFNQVTPIVNGSIAPSLAPTNLSEKQPTIMINGSATLITAQTHARTIAQTTSHSLTTHSRPPVLSPDYIPPESPPVLKPPTPYPFSDDSQDPDYTRKEVGTYTDIRPGYPYTGKK